MHFLQFTVWTTTVMTHYLGSYDDSFMKNKEIQNENKKQKVLSKN